MKISANDIKLGNILELKNELWLVIKQPERTKTGKGGAYVQVEMKSLRTGNKNNCRFGSSESIEKIFIESKTMQYLYSEDDHLVLMNPESFEQIIINKSVANDKLPFIMDGMEIDVEFYQDTPLKINLPVTVIMEILETPPVVKGATVKASYKQAIVTNGLKVTVPGYLGQGEKILIRTEDGTFVERAK